jgi:geranylgeranyl pyrophosphate synthase
MRASSEPITAIGPREVRDFFRECREQTDARLDELVPAETTEPSIVHQAMRWSLFAGGKRLRPALLLATGRAFGAEDASLLNIACALEMIHTYSLIHDDLPSMDDDFLRRGRPTCHIRFDEATAGTPGGMIAGQAYDLAAESREVTGDELERIHRHKTGALFIAAVRSGATIAGANGVEMEAVTRYGASIGLLFQITDDLLDVTATAEDLGKTPGKDERARKATYPSLYGIEASRKSAIAVHAEACAALLSIERPSAPHLLLLLLRAIADLILERRA